MSAILIVEDTPALANNLKANLAFAGYENSTIAEHGQAAVELVETGRDFSIIIMDVNMPVMDGYAATQAIRKLGYQKPIIGYSSMDSPENIEQGLAAGMNAYLAKGADFDVLRELLEEHGLQPSAS